MLKPSLYALYKQGRFRKPGFDDTEEGMRQVERFAVAMLALVLNHEPEFLKAFLQKVCGRNQTETDAILVELEVGGCGDLVLRNADNSKVYVFEFKVDSPIQGKNQDPTKPEFFTTGYGAGIKEKYGNKATYILVQNEAKDLSKAAEKIPLCLGKSWRDIFNCSHHHPLVCDLFKSFGSLGIPEFIHMNTKNMSLGRGEATLEAAKINELLKAVAGRIGSKKPTLDIALESKGGYIGMNFSPGVDFDEWQRLVQPKGNIIGWFGYQSQNGKSTLDVWFYCGDKNAAMHIHRRLESHFSQAEEKVTPPNAENYVRISLAAEKSADNQEWFISIFKLFVQRK